MAQQHLDRLSAIDASFLHNEGDSSHMHVGAITVFEGPPPSIEDLSDHIRSRLHLVPRYRQKLAVPPLETSRPLWVDDPNFNLGYHVRHTALPAPGSEADLLRLAARIFSQRLDRSKPLWELWVVEGLADHRFALLSKTHHAVVDGVAGVDLATVLFDASPVPEPLEQGDGGEPWHPRPEPSAADLIAGGIKGLVRTSVDLAARTLSAATHPASTVDRVLHAVEGVGEIAWAGLNPAPDTPLNVEIGPHRRYAVVRASLADYRTVKSAFGATVNDVVLTVVAGALGDFLRSRGVRTEGLELRGLVPVSIRAKDDHQLGNRIAVMRGPLPVYIRDPVARLRVVKEAMDDLKSSKQAVGAEALANVQNLAPPTILAQASRLNFSTRLFNLIVTNVPGPQFPLYVLGRELQDLFPVAFLPENHALAIAIMSYNGTLNYGLLADYDAVPDLDLIAEGIDRGIADLLAAARDGGNGTPSKRKRATAAKGRSTNGDSASARRRSPSNG